MLNAGQVVSRATLIKEGQKGQNCNIDVGISKLRSKIDKNFAYPLLHTERGVGFRMHKDKLDS